MRQLPIAPDYRATFVAYLSQLGYAPSSIITYTSAIGCVRELAAAIVLDQVRLTSSQLIVTITKFKHDASRLPMDIVMPAQYNSICPVDAISTYLQLRGNHPGPLFRFPDGCAISRAFFADKLERCLNFNGIDTQS